MGMFKQFGNWVGEKFEDISGETSAQASRDAASIQASAAEKAAASQLEAGKYAADQQLAAGKYASDMQLSAANSASQLQAGSEAKQLAAQQAGALANRQDLQGAVDLGASMQPGYKTAMDQQASLYGAGAGDQIMNNPMFQAIQKQNQEAILSNQSLGGRLNTGETPQFMQDSALRTGFDVLNQERQAALQNSQSFLNPMQMGFNAAAMQGQGSMQLGNNMANTMQNSVGNQNMFGTNAALNAGKFGTAAAGNASNFNVNANTSSNGYMTDGAAAQAAGKVGAANAYTAGTANLINLGVAAATGMPPKTNDTGGGGGFTGGFTSPFTRNDGKSINVGGQ
jgi:hypothetical protein